MTPLASGRRLLCMLLRQRGRVAGVIALTVGYVGLSVAVPKLLGHATDLIFAGVIGRDLPAGTTNAQAVAHLRATGHGTLATIAHAAHVVPGEGIDLTAVGGTLGWVLAVSAVACVLGIAQGRLITTIVSTTVYDLRALVQAKLARLPLAYVERQARGEVTSRVTTDIDNVARGLHDALDQAIWAALTIVGTTAMMLATSPLLAVVALVTVPSSIAVSTAVGRRAQPRFTEQWASAGALSAHVEEACTGHLVLKAFGREEVAADAFDTHNAALYEAGFRAQFVSGIIAPAILLLGNVTYVLIAVIGALRVATGAISLGDVTAFIAYARDFGQPIASVAGTATVVQSGLASARRVFDLLDAPEQTPDPDPPVRLRAPAGRVTFENVSFGYRPDTPVLTDLSLTAEPGQTVAIVGSTGAGKTTLVNLLLRFYDPTCGRIALDGVDIARLTRAELRGIVGTVSQDTWLFAGTIADNIGYGARDPTRASIVEAALATHVDHFVRTLPAGYDTVISGDGGGLSAGEQQLITIARAFLSEPVILVLDEATSSVDTRTEVLIQRAMTSLRSGRTSFVIAHRLSTIRDADVIAVLDGGRIVERGTHDELLAADGAYRRLYAAGFGPSAAPV